MTNPFITLAGVSCILPDGRTLFSNLNEHFDARRTGLVGANGAGKSILAQIMAGLREPSGGRCLRSGRVHYLAQQIRPAEQATVADLAGVRPILDALARIEHGSIAPPDFDLIGQDWDLPARLRSTLDRLDLVKARADTLLRELSGGELMRVALAGAFLSQADFLILDEPSNHLDRHHRQALIQALRDWHAGLLVISHDRALLAGMERIVKLSCLGLRSYDGNYRFYAEQQEQERRQAQDRLRHHELEQRKQERAMREQRERLEQRQARGRKDRRNANQAKALLDFQKARSEHSAGKLKQGHADASQKLQQLVRQAARDVDDEADINLHALPDPMSARRVLARLEAVVLPHGAQTAPLDLIIFVGQRLALVGPNGCGKTSLLKLLAGQLQPLSGACSISARCAWLDQGLDKLDPQETVLAQILAANPELGEAGLRMRLAQLGLDAARITQPSGQLSGGERLKAALACLIYAAPAPDLLLDEPDNHLDLPSLRALEAMLRSYRGALLVASHDDAFLEQAVVRDRLGIEDGAWILQQG